MLGPLREGIGRSIDFSDQVGQHPYSDRFYNSIGEQVLSDIRPARNIEKDVGRIHRPEVEVRHIFDLLREQYLWLSPPGRSRRTKLLQSLKTSTCEVRIEELCCETVLRLLKILLPRLCLPTIGIYTKADGWDNGSMEQEISAKGQSHCCQGM